MEGDFSHVSLLDSSKRAIPLTPSEWRKRLETLNGKRDTKYILLDIRNGTLLFQNLFSLNFLVKVALVVYLNIP